MMGQWDDFGGWGMGFGFLFMILFWALVLVLVVAGIVALVRWLLPAREAPRLGGGRAAAGEDTAGDRAGALCAW